MGQRRGEKKKHIGQGGCSSAKWAEWAHPQLVHWWVLIHSNPFVLLPHSNHQSIWKTDYHAPKHQNHQYSTKDELCNLGKTIITIHNKMVMDLMLIMNLVQCTHNFEK